MSTADERLIRKAVDLASQRLGASVICRRCGATCETMADRCTAALDAACEGFVAYDEARTRALHDVGFFKGGRA